MGLPSENVEGYREGSPITYAHQLQGDLLVVHGTGDDNCHYATVEKLFDELIRHGKQFTMMAYPNRTHSIRERAGTTMHLRTLLTNYLQDHVPPGGRPPAAEKTPATEAKPSNPQKKKKEAKHGSE
jgi:dipeptidyl-peptidase-4